MRQLAVAELQIGRSESFIYQRRDGNVTTSPHRLGWFGGPMEVNERPIDAIKRELSEETSLEISRLIFKGPRVIEVPAEHSSSKSLTVVNLFMTIVRKTDINFKVHKGTRAEVFTHADLLATNEVAATVRYILDPSGENKL